MVESRHVPSRERDADEASLASRDDPVLVEAGPSRYSAVQFLVALVLLISVSPALEDSPRGALLEAILLTLILVSAVPAIGGGRRTTLLAGLLASTAAAGKWLHHLRPDLVPQSFFLGAAVIFAAFIVAHHLRFILQAPEVDTQVLCAGISTFLMIGLLWAFGYLLLDTMSPGSLHVDADVSADKTLSGFAALYFSFAMLSGMAFGEILPQTNGARMLAQMESLISLFYMAILISRLVALHTERATSRR
jgi:hypothetical protein